VAQFFMGLRRVTRMNNNKRPKIMLNCGPNGRRRLGRPLMSVLDEPKQVYQGLTNDGWWWWRRWWWWWRFIQIRIYV